MRAVRGDHRPDDGPGRLTARRLDQLSIHDTFVDARYGTMLTSGAASLVGLTYAKLTARLGYAALMRIAAGAWTAALLVFAVAGHWAVLLLVPVLTGIGSGITMPTLTVLADRAARAEQCGIAAALQATALFGGKIAAPLLFGPLIDSISIATGALVAATGTAGILAALFRLREPEQSVGVAESEREGPRRAPVGE
ncbi:MULTISPECIES: MFS transporter [Streptomyces]|uniref:MFS family permease n=1 Tax=Streptomyces demainii TaxID=588122 RepID=A0ABT9KHT4_9ACTN|nr:MULTISPECIES: MFS transporter [Streptomyces]MDP9607964.1 MFS family permease [Streptomyces demainii]